MTRPATLVALFTLAAATPASAHLGHLGEAAGHAHWIGLGAIAGAALLAGLLGKGGQKPQADAEEDETPETEEVPA